MKALIEKELDNLKAHSIIEPVILKVGGIHSAYAKSRQNICEGMQGF